MDDVTYFYAYTAHYYEVDENNVIRATHVDPYGEFRLGEATLFESRTLQYSDSPISIQWRRHDQVAIEVSYYKQAIALHDLVDESNTHLMVVTKQNAMIQGRLDQVLRMASKVWESWGLGGSDSVLSFRNTVSDPDAIRRRRQERQGGLVDIHYKYLPMDWKKAEELMAKKFLEPDGKSLVLLELRPGDASPPGNLKPGRRLLLTLEAGWKQKD